MNVETELCIVSPECLVILLICPSLSHNLTMKIGKDCENNVSHVLRINSFISKDCLVIKNETIQQCDKQIFFYRQFELETQFSQEQQKMMMQHEIMTYQYIGSNPKIPLNHLFCFENGKSNENVDVLLNYLMISYTMGLHHPSSLILIDENHPMINEMKQLQFYFTQHNVSYPTIKEFFNHIMKERRQTFVTSDEIISWISNQTK